MRGVHSDESRQQQQQRRYFLWHGVRLVLAKSLETALVGSGP